MRNITDVIRERQGELYTTLSELIKIDSQSSGEKGNEKEIAFFIADKIKKLGYEPDVYCPLDIEGFTEHPEFFAAHDLRERYNVSAVIAGKDRTRRIMLAAHNDTVSVGDPALWDKDPFSGEINDGKIWGRGACDDKYGIAAVLFLIKVFKDEGIEFPCDIVFTAYCNEEYGGSHGALAACLRYPCDEVINLDCKDFEICTCAVGGEEMRAHICAEGSVDDCGVMLEGLAVLKDEFSKFRDKRRAELRAHPEYKNSSVPDDSVRFLELKAGNAGTALDRAHAEICYYASSSKEEIDDEFAVMAKQIDKRLAPLGLCFDRYEKTTRFFHFCKTEEGAPIIDALKAAAQRATGRELKICGSCQSDLSIFLKYGSLSSVSFGVGRGFGVSGGAHQNNEYIECDRFLEFVLILGELFAERK